MPTPTIHTKATVSAYRCLSEGSPVFPIGRSKTTSYQWQCLAIQGLRNFEKVHQQFVASGITFEGAIAVRPSNPRFQLHAGALTIIPACNRNGIKVDLSPRVAQINLGFINSQAITFALLSAEKHCIASVKVPPSPQFSVPHSIELSGPDLQGITLDTDTAVTLRIESPSPFTLGRFWVKQA